MVASAHAEGGPMSSNGDGSKGAETLDETARKPVEAQAPDEIADRPSGERFAAEAADADSSPKPDAPSEQPVSKPPANGKRSEKKRWSLAPKLVDEARYKEIQGQRAKALLAVDNISVSFDGFKALTDLTLILDEGELRCIIGPNGAGKTTLMDVITGKTRPDQGTVFMLGNNDRRDLTRLSEHEVAGLGIGRKFQRPTVFHGHTVLENIELALAGNRGLLRALFSRRKKAEQERIDEVLETIGLTDRRDALAGFLSHGQKQWLEIGMLLAQDPKVLLVDEPVAGMTHQEIDRTAELLRSLAGKRTVVVVEHDMDFVRSIARTVTVLHEGKVLAEGPMDKIQNDPVVIEVYLGE
jgi:urea transport system ATP-binding protein